MLKQSNEMTEMGLADMSSKVPALQVSHAIRCSLFGQKVHPNFFIQDRAFVTSLITEKISIMIQ